MKPAASSADARWRAASVVGCGLLVAGVACFGLDAGITWDELSQAKYGDLVLRWFSSGFRDTSALRFENLFLYGGLFEAIAQLAVRASPLGAFETRHLLTASVALVGIVAASCTASRVAGPRAGFLAGLCLALTPAWIGHGWFNSKDIPFATAASLTTWAAVRIATRSSPLRRPDVLLIGVILGAALGIRPGGYFQLAYLFLAAGLGAAVGSIRDGLPLRSSVRATNDALRGVLGAVPITWVVMVVAWPWAWESPLVRPLVAMTLASRFPFDGKTLFDGQLLAPADLPGSYLPTWFAITMPEFYAIAFTAGLIALAVEWRPRSEPKTAGVAIIVITIVLPVAGAMITCPGVYDGLRHFLFVIPSLASLAGIAVSAFIATKRIPQWIRAILVGLFACACGVTLKDIVALHPYEYVYFNRAFGGLPAAEGRFETDYWGASYKEGLEWLVEQPLKKDGQPLTVASCNDNSNRRLAYYLATWPDASRHVRIVRTEQEPEVFMESTRRHLCSRLDGPVIHTVVRSGVPLLYVRSVIQHPVVISVP